MTLLLPIFVMLGSYLIIIVTVNRRRKNSAFMESGQRAQILNKAKLQTIRLTGVLVLGFILCWTPYYISTFW